jgi:uncharacterized protein
MMFGNLNERQIDQILRTAYVAHLGCAAGDRVYVVPLGYVYDGENIYIHSVDGLKLTMMQMNPHVCIEVEQIENLANWRSVIALGEFSELVDAEAEQAMQLLADRLMPLVASETSMSPHGLKSTSAGLHGHVYRIHLTERSGRYEKR